MKVIWERMAEDCTFLDVYNPILSEKGQVTHSEKIEGLDEENTDQPTYVAAINGKYLLSYDEDPEKEEEKNS